VPRLDGDSWVLVVSMAALLAVVLLAVVLAINPHL